MISTKVHKLHREQSLLHWKRKFGELLFPNKKIIDADVDLPKIDCARNFEQLQCSVAHIKTSTTGNKLDQLPSLTCWEKKFHELRFTNEKVIDTDVNLPKLKIRCDFGQLQTLTANISGVDRHTENR